MDTDLAGMWVWSPLAVHVSMQCYLMVAMKTLKGGICDLLF
jgi:hypothetical protein